MRARRSSALHAYLDGLKMLARRELSEAQVRQRLVRRSHEADAIDEAIARLKDARAIDDRASPKPSRAPKPRSSVAASCA